MQVGRVPKLQGEIRPPSDKSLTHRAYLFGAMGRGETVVEQPLEGEDCEATLRIVGQMGVAHHRKKGRTFILGREDWQTPDAALDCGNSGTTMRLLTGILASREGLETTLIGDSSLSKRPMGRVVTPLTEMGAQIEGDKAPLHIHGKHLHGIRYTSPVASAQIKSCLLLAGLRAEGETWVTEPSKSRDHTERMFQALGVPLLRDGDLTVGVKPATWDGFKFRVPGDISSAAFWLVAAAIVPGSEITLKEVGINPTRTGVIDVLKQAHAGVGVTPDREELGEPVGFIDMHYVQDLRGFTIEGDLVPRLIDEIPVLAVLATQCNGTTIVRDAKEMRVKETDRIAKVTEGLKAMGADIEATEDGFVINGPTKLKAAHIEAAEDHRIAMTFAIAGMIADGTTTIEGAESILTSYPTFWDHFHALATR